MNTITVVKRGTTTQAGALRIYCGRGSALGNPHHMTNSSLAERNRVCDAYAADFGTEQQLSACRVIWKTAQHQNVELECFCAPLRCHCDTVKSFIESHLK